MPLRTHVRAALLIGAALSLTGGVALIVQAREAPRPYCRVTAIALPTTTPGQYRVRWETRPDCPEGGHAYVRLESGRVYPWREVVKGVPTLSRPVPWYWKSRWRSQSGKATYPLNVPGMLSPWESP
ncbi:hypothetical protein [Deinococcus sp. NW-56]|uniref:hypothetical protein n=1 Tax=Deinococcus sp. NW-56 TaxID=2080419 RepID=UPI000CF4E366|nr:hypothetical protein [Deinococcus sp. NW-56]